MPYRLHEQQRLKSDCAYKTAYHRSLISLSCSHQEQDSQEPVYMRAQADMHMFCTLMLTATFQLTLPKNLCINLTYSIQ